MKLSSSKLNALFRKVAGKKILVIGDYMLDIYLLGEVNRISPEAPVPIVNIKKCTMLPGGAANVVHNLHKLGAYPVPVGVVGDDTDGKNLIAQLKAMKIDVSGLIIDKGRPTTTKTRILGQQQQIVRADYESQEDLSEKIEAKLLHVLHMEKSVQGIIIEDYNKGVCTRTLCRQSIGYGKERDIPVTVDPKQKNFEYFKGATVLKPNKKEAVQLVNHPMETEQDIKKAVRNIRQFLKLEAVLITLGEKGMVLYEKNMDLSEFPSVARKVFDVSGAGDTVISSLTAFICAGASFKEAAYLANQAAGIVIGEVGTSAVSLKQIKEAIE
jgi:D-beta-D-heptose 7-phosphate kinase/D-beta-D-heptose 1-phosphate adenosyltransferase